jgi:hypothetical protein
MAPEQLRGDPANARSDQFALGVVFYEALYGSHPYRPTGEQTISQAVLAGALREPPPRADVPRAVRDAILRAVAHDPAERHASVEAFLLALGPLPASRDDIAKLAAAARRMLANHRAPAAARLLDAVDGIEQAIADLDAKASLLQKHVDDVSEDELARQRDELRARLQRGESDERDLARQAASLDARLEGLARARKTLDTLRTRRATVASQLEALHLDLARAQAEDASLPDLSEPLHDLQIEVEAAREVESLLR